MHVGPIHGRKRRRAPDAGINAGSPKRPDDRQRTVDASAPQHVPVENLLRVMGHQPGLALTVPYLLMPVGLHLRSMVVPDQRGRRKANLPAARLQPPADIDVIARAKIDWIEPPDREKRFAPKRHIA